MCINSKFEKVIQMFVFLFNDVFEKQQGEAFLLITISDGSGYVDHGIDLLDDEQWVGAKNGKKEEKIDSKLYQVYLISWLTDISD